ncbi:tat pathway signal sequence domain-containing protein [Xylariaceae sp. FL1019]|nr:tat pathway signal sequence domain-containing protein [Xylariaceae sp. FL1019]
MRLSGGLLAVFAGLTSAGGCPYAARSADPEASAGSGAGTSGSTAPIAGKNGIMYMNRIAPSGAQLYVANADGSNAKALMGNQTNPFDYHSSWSADGKWIVFTSERRKDGQSDIYRIKPDGTGLEALVDTDAFEDAGTLSPDGTKLAYVSTQGNHTANIWVKDLATGVAQNLTDTPSTRGDPASPQGHFRPAWSPSGEWIAFSSDRNTDWTGHSDGTGWEHTQTLAIYVIRPDGSDFRKVIGQDSFSLANPQWSADGSRIIYNNITTEDTYAAHGLSFGANVPSTLHSVDVATGTNIVTINDDAELKLSQSFLGNSSNVGYVIKTGTNQGIAYTVPDATHKAFTLENLRNPSWSPDGTKVVYEVYAWDQRPAEMELFSFSSDWEYRFMDVFPQFHNDTKKMALTSKQLGNSSVWTSDADFDDVSEPFSPFSVWDASNDTQLGWVTQGTGGAFQPTFNSDGSQIAVGLGLWFGGRNSGPATIYLAAADGSSHINLTDGSLNAGFPSFSPNENKLVYRLWDPETSSPLGLRILDLDTMETTNLTWGWDNTPGWSPDGERIVFARQTNWTASYGSRWYEDRFDIFTIKPDGSELTQVTTSHANDAHAVWSYDGRIMWNSGMYGFRDESVAYDSTFQPYGQIMIMDADGSNKEMLTDSMWEDSMPLLIPNESL